MSTSTNPTRGEHRRLSERNDQIEAAYLSGRSLASIGRQWSMTRERVRQILETRGVDRRDSGHYARIAYNDWARTDGPAVDAAFDRLRSVARVCAANPKWNATYVRRYLEPRRHEAVQMKMVAKTFSDEQLLDALRVANGQLPRLTSAGYGAWRTAQADKGIIWPAGITITLRFGSWSRAKSLALGTEERGVTRVRAWTPEQAQSAVKDYLRFTLEHNHRPSSAGYTAWVLEHRPEAPSLAYLRVLTDKSWSELVITAYEAVV